MSPSSSLQSLERVNRSRSTMSSSDTDIDSAGYASSSGTTTPEDETQMFHLGHRFPNNPAEESKRGLQGKPKIVNKFHNLSAAVKRVKKTAHAMVVFKKKRPDDISPILISSPLRERFGKRMSVKCQPDEGFYSLPNRRFSLSDVSAPPVSISPTTSSSSERSPEVAQPRAQAISRKFGTISGSNSTFIQDSFRKQRNVLPIPSFSEAQHTSPAPSTETIVPIAEVDPWTSSRMLAGVLRISFFVPWCAAVGGTLLLFPDYVELVAFHSGYLSPPRGIRRFAHWAECGQQHAMIFIAFLALNIWFNYTLGLSLACIVGARFLFVWNGFKVDKRIALGEDDQQSFYLVVMGVELADGWLSVNRRRGVMESSDLNGMQGLEDQ